MEALSRDTLALFSAPARRFLRGLGRRRAPSREEVVARLRAAGRPVFEAVVDFEVRLGGLAFGPPGDKRDVRLGIEWDAPRAEADEPGHPDHTMVPIGLAHDEYDRLFMNEAGEVVSYVDSVVMKNRSIFTYIEQEILRRILAYPAPSFCVGVGPPMGEALAAALGLRPVEAASDEYVAWWEGRGLRLEQVFFPGSWMAKTTTVVARTVRGAARVLAAARAVDPASRVALVAEPRRTVIVPEERASAKVPAIDAWRARRGAIEYAYASVDGRITGQVWVVPERGGTQIEQYRFRRRTSGELQLMAWDTITEKGERTREIEYFLLD